MRLIEFEIHILSFVLIIALYLNNYIVNGTNNEWYNDDGIVFRKNLDWMSDIPDSSYLNSISIPGTHNTMAYHTSLISGIWVQCQSMTLNDQLKAGIRALDIRCRHIRDNLTIHHGAWYLNVKFDYVLDDVTNFLKIHSKEVILMRVKEEHIAEEVTESFAGTFIKYITDSRFSPFIWRGRTDQGASIGVTDNPMIGEVRGKIVILADFTVDYPYGILWDHFNIQDNYEVPTSNELQEKLDKVMDQLKKSENDKYDHMFVNFLSGSSLRVPPHTVAYFVNKQIYYYLNKPTGKTGIMYMDFPGGGIISRIIERNTQYTMSMSIPMSIPFGFIYFQLAGQLEPKYLWPNLRWTDVTSDYAGLFFRAEGEGSEAFGRTQEEASPRLDTVFTEGDTYHYRWNYGTIVDGPAVNTYGGVAERPLKFHISGAEVRPRNSAMRIWKRTK